MDATTTTAKRIHPLMATAAASVIIASAVATAAITGVLPSSHSATEPQSNAAANPAQQLAAQAQNAQAPLGAQPAPANAQANGQQYAQPYQPVIASAAPVPASNVQPAPEVQQNAPAVHRSARPVHHHTQVASYDDGGYQQRQAAPAPRQPNYVAMGTGAVIGGLLGNQVGSGNGRKLATVAGIIGGGLVGNEIANRNQ